MPTENVSVIDPGGGGDYLTIAAWEAATDNDLVAADVIEIGELVTGTHDTSATTVTITGATTDATRYRILRAQSGAEYDPITGTGALITHTGAGYPFLIREEGFRLCDVGVSWTVASPTASNGAIGVSSDATNSNGVGVLLDGVTMMGAFTSGTNLKGYYGISTAAFPKTLRNCIAVGTGSSTTGFTFGYDEDHATIPTTFQNCVAYQAGSRGFDLAADIAHVLRNCVSAESPTADFGFVGSTVDAEYCASSDATADDAGGTGHLTSIVAADEFVDPANNDFRLKGTGQLFGAGTDLSADFTTDIAGDTWGPWSIGAYRATSLEVWSNGAWGPADPQTGVNQGRVTYYRWTKQQAQNADSDPIPTAGATRVIAYLGTVTSGSGASDGLRINPLPYPRASAALEPDITVAAGKRHIAGVINTSTAASNKAAVCFAPSGAASIYLRNMDTTSSPIIDIVIEVHR